jgi:hypothetical protein
MRIFVFVLSLLFALSGLASAENIGTSPQTSRQSIGTASTTATTAGTTFYYVQGASGTTNANANSASPISGTFKNLVLSIASAPGTGNSVTVTLYTGSAQGALAATTLTCTISNSSKECDTSLTGLSTVIPAWSYWAWVITASASATSTGTVALGVEFDNP